MPTERRTQGVVYRWGRRSSQNCTPRLGIDTTGRPGLREPGLSITERLDQDRVAVKIDISLLKFPLRVFADDPESAGPLGHLTITPITPSGEVDHQLLEEWASSRAPDGMHPLTQIVLDAIIAEKVRGPV